MTLGLLLASPNAFSLVSVNGYSAFGHSLQKESDGGRNTFSLSPSLGLNTMISLKSWKHFFTPEIGVVLDLDGHSDDYSKHTTYILFDLGHPLSPRSLLRYGIGLFTTSIRGKGGTSIQRNGNEKSAFTRPAETVNSYNLTLNFGIEHQLFPKWSIRFEAFVFSILDKHSRNLSYSLGINFYPF